MCGILGLAGGEGSKLPKALIKPLMNDLLLLSESRGKESSGVAMLSRGIISVYKRPVPASTLIHESKYNGMLSSIADDGSAANPGGSWTSSYAIIGHARLVTNGAMEINQNNQPVVKEGLVAVHNGIVVNDGAIWADFPALKKDYDVDTEAILALIRMFLKGHSLAESICKTFAIIRGEASIAVLLEDANCLVLATNTGSIHMITSKDSQCCLFASEEYIMRTLHKRYNLQKILGECIVMQVTAGTGAIIDLDTIKVHPFSLADENVECTLLGHTRSTIVDLTTADKNQAPAPLKQASLPSYKRVNEIKLAFTQSAEAIDRLRRCSRCVLPETVPFIEFDEEGVCNFCRNHKATSELGTVNLEALADRYRSRSGKPDCIVSFSGGRDSSYGLHYVKTVLKMNPIAYSYDWGMITDLGRRNQARLCGKLGVEHIWVSADIKRKRENVRKNILAWLDKPHLGMVPLFMAGDKQYFYFCNRLRKQTQIKLVFLCENPLEKTDFKSGFCDVKPKYGVKSTYALTPLNKVKIASFYAWQYLRNPHYINVSLSDTLVAFFAYYLMKHHYVNIYHYIRWDEDKIESTLLSEYDWEKATDTKTTWRIGDGTAPFYNYIYFMVAGFTENDTFRSNQIRDGMISRDKAMELVRRDNWMRLNSLEWYCDTIGIDTVSTLERINSIPKLYGQLSRG